MSTPRYTIRFVHENAGLCSACSDAVGLGPIGWEHDAGPLCDACLIERQRHLGMVLVLANLFRELGAILPQDSDDDFHLMAMTITIARLYERNESKVWPYRPLDFLGELAAAVRQVDAADGHAH